MIYVLAGMIVWAIVMYFFMGEKYMRWYYRQCGRYYLDYDMGRFKVAHGVCLVLVSLFGMLTLLVDRDHDAVFIVLMFLALIMNYVLIFTWCKKKDSSSK